MAVIMFKNFNKARQEKGVSIVDIADHINVHPQIVNDKIQGKDDFKFKEVVMIRRKFFPEYDLAYLFQADDIHQLVND